MSRESFKDKGNKFNNGVRELIARAKSGESVLIVTDVKPKYRSAIKFLDINEELIIADHKDGLMLTLKKEKRQEQPDSTKKKIENIVIPVSSDSGITSKIKYICQLPELEQNAIREKLRAYLISEGFGDTIEIELQNAMDSKIDDIDWGAINLWV